MILANLDSLTWRKLVPASLAGGLILAGGIWLGTPQPAVTQVVCCIGCSGNLCSASCTRECSNGSCCEWEFYYKKTDADTTFVPE